MYRLYTLAFGRDRGGAEMLPRESTQHNCVHIMYRNIIIFSIIFVYVRTRLFCPRTSCPVSEISLDHGIPDTRVKLL